MNTVRWRPRALEVLARIVRRISEENPVAARQVGRELVLAGDSLSLFPYRGRVGRVPGTRELVVCHPYILVYRIASNGEVTITWIWHGAQNR